MFVGVTPGQNLPILNFPVNTPQNFLRLVAVLLIAAILYLFFEWKQSSVAAKSSPWSQARGFGTTIFACTALWFSHDEVAAGTSFASVSPAWYVGFGAIGLVLGNLIAVVMLAMLMIRTPAQARKLGLPRVPAATRGQLITWVPVIAMLVLTYHVALHFAPIAIHAIAALAVVLSILFIVAREYWFLFLDDADGNPGGNRRIHRLREIFDSHDYSYQLIDQRSELRRSSLSAALSPAEMQNAVRARYQMPADFPNSVQLQVELQEEVRLSFYLKNRDAPNPDVTRVGLRIRKADGTRGMLHVRVHMRELPTQARDAKLPLPLVELLADQYLAQADAGDALTIRKAFSHGLNQAVVQMMEGESEPKVLLAAQFGLEADVRRLIAEGVNVHERGSAGWTALLWAAANGYPEIAQVLLDAGADPNAGNLHKITPLMYGARYGNEAVCKTLLEYGADANLQDIHGRTALMTAARFGEAGVTTLLLRGGANAGIRDRDGKSALDIARDNRHGKLAKILHHEGRAS
jgi:uncharacterized protein